MPSDKDSPTPTHHAAASPENGARPPRVSIVIVTYNSEPWLTRCLESIRGQSIVQAIEIIIVDNASTDASVALAERLLDGFAAAILIRSPENLGFCEGNNLGSRSARGTYLLFLNPDTWMEPLCLERLLAGTNEAGAAAATPWVLNYADNTHQDLGFFGFDLFGLPSPSRPAAATREVFVASGCACLVERTAFEAVGRFDPMFFMYSEEVDLCWRLWISGRRIVGVPAARLHHRGATTANPAGGSQVTAYQTSDRKRFLSNRNCLMTLLKNGRSILLLPAIPMLVLFFLESLLGAILLRRASFFSSSFSQPLRDCWRLRHDLRARRAQVAAIRRRPDVWMLRFLRLPLNRWYEIKRLARFGIPRVTTANPKATPS